VQNTRGKAGVVVDKDAVVRVEQWSSAQCYMCKPAWCTEEYRSRLLVGIKENVGAGEQGCDQDMTSVCD